MIFIQKLKGLLLTVLVAEIFIASCVLLKVQNFALGVSEAAL
jgi:hypothetical protein